MCLSHLTKGGGRQQGFKWISLVWGWCESMGWGTDLLALAVLLIPSVQVLPVPGWSTNPHCIIEEHRNLIQHWSLFAKSWGKGRAPLQLRCSKAPRSLTAAPRSNQLNTECIEPAACISHQWSLPICPALSELLLPLSLLNLSQVMQ